MRTDLNRKKTSSCRLVWQTQDRQIKNCSHDSATRLTVIEISSNFLIAGLS